MDTVVELKNASLIRRFFSFIIDYILLIPLILILYQLWKEKLWQGQSIGNKIMKIKVIDNKTGKKPSLIKIIIKNLVFILTIGLGTITIPANDGRRGLQDILSGILTVNNFKTDTQ